MLLWNSGKHSRCRCYSRGGYSVSRLDLGTQYLARPRRFNGRTKEAVISLLLPQKPREWLSVALSTAPWPKISFNQLSSSMNLQLFSQVTCLCKEPIWVQPLNTSANIGPACHLFSTVSTLTQDACSAVGHVHLALGGGIVPANKSTLVPLTLDV